MDYKEKYQQALERARQFSEHPLQEDSANIVEYIFPELAESEDEKIRKELIDAIYGLWDNDALPMPLSVKRKDEWIAWLEKQKPVTDINPSEFEARLSTLLKQFETLPKEDIIDGLKFYLNVVENDGTYKEQKPKWSEKDVKMIDSLISHCKKEYEDLCNDKYGHQEIVSDLKQSCRERRDWFESLKERMAG